MKFILIGFVCAIALTTVQRAISAESQLQSPPSSLPYGTSFREMGKKGWVPFHGTVSAVDLTGQTVTVKGLEHPQVFTITPLTKISKLGKPSTLKETQIGDYVDGVATATDEHTFRVIMLALGKPEDWMPKAIRNSIQGHWVRSPYAPDKPAIYVGRMRHAVLRCPYTHKPFVLP